MAHSQPRSPARSMLVVALFAAMLGGGALVGFFQIFSRFQGYDDEGYVMISVQSFLNGRALYDQVYTQYGPAYYLYKGAIHRGLGLPVTHDVVRVLTLAAWLLAVLFCSLVSYRLTGALLLGAAVFLLDFRSLWEIVNEPGHPQELCALLLAAGVYVASFAATATRLRWVLPALGAITAALVLTKINVGLYFGWALAGTLVAFGASNKWRSVFASLLVGLAVLVPLVLMCAHLDISWRQNYAAVSVLACLSTTVIASFAGRDQVISLRLATAALAGFVSTLLLIFVTTLACGTSAAGFWDGVVLNPLRFAEAFSVPANVPTAAVLGAIVACVSALGYCLYVRGLLKIPAQLAVALPGVGAAARFLFVIGVFLAGFGLMGDVRQILAFATPWIWLVLIGPADSQLALDRAFGRTMLALTATFQVLHAYPVAGSQVSISTFLTIPAAAICARDLWRQLQGSAFRLSATSVRAGAIVACLAIAGGWCGIGISQLPYLRLTPLDLPGAQWIRLDMANAAVLRCVALNLRDDCDTFFSAPGMNSFYFWSGRKPPTDFNVGHWMTLNDAQQRAIIEAMEQHPNACLLYQPNLNAMWLQLQGKSPDVPLVRYCRDNFKPFVRVGSYDLCVRPGRQLPPLVEAANVGPLPRSVASRLSDYKLPKGASPNALIELRLQDADLLAVADRLIIADAADGRRLIDSRDDSIHGMKIFDETFHPIELPLLPGWNSDRSVASVYLMPYEPLPKPKELDTTIQTAGSSDEYDYSQVIVGLLDKQNKPIQWVPLAIPWR